MLNPGRILDSSRVPAKWALRVSTETAGSVHVLVLAGRVGHASSAVLADTIARLLESGTPRLVVDFAGVDYISSAGLQVMERTAAAATASGGALVVTGLSDPVRLGFDLAGLLTTIACEPSRPGAIARASGHRGFDATPNRGVEGAGKQ